MHIIFTFTLSFVLSFYFCRGYASGLRISGAARLVTVSAAVYWCGSCILGRFSGSTACPPLFLPYTGRRWYSVYKEGYPPTTLIQQAQVQVNSRHATSQTPLQFSYLFVLRSSNSLQWFIDPRDLSPCAVLPHLRSIHQVMSPRAYSS